MTVQRVTEKGVESEPRISARATYAATLAFLHFVGTSFETAVAAAIFKHPPVLRAVGVKCRVDKRLQTVGSSSATDAQHSSGAKSPAPDSK